MNFDEYDFDRRLKGALAGRSAFAVGRGRDAFLSRAGREPSHFRFASPRLLLLASYELLFFLKKERERESLMGERRERKESIVTLVLLFRIVPSSSRPTKADTGSTGGPGALLAAWRWCVRVVGTVAAEVEPADRWSSS